MPINPLGPLVKTAEEMKNISSNMLTAAQEVGGSALSTAFEFGLDAAHKVASKGQDVVETAVDAGKYGLGLSEQSLRKLGKIGAGLLPALGDKNSDPKPED